MNHHTLTKDDWHQRAAALSFPDRPFIDGEFVAGDGEPIAAVNPATGKTLVHVQSCSPENIDQAVRVARDTYERGVWRTMPLLQKKNVLLRLAALLNEHSHELALLETMDMGKPISDTLLFDLPETIRCFTWYAEALDKLYDNIAPTDAHALATITREPLGVVAAVVPWNYPLMMASWKVAPALAMGNSVLLKPAEQSSLTALRLAELATEAGIPPGVFNVTPGTGPVAGKALGLHPDVDCLSFTGSTQTGKYFMQYSGQSNLKQVWLECGGKSPHIIFDDCPDLDRAALAAATGIFNNQGEVCIAGSRLYVQSSIYDAFMEKLDQLAHTMHPGDPLDPTSMMGAMVDEQHMQRVLDFIQVGLDDGAQLRTGGGQVRADTGGYYIQPTIFEGVEPHHVLMREEVFGPVLNATRFETEDEALTLANDSPYGLGAGLWTQNLARAHRVAGQLRVGLVWVNCYFDGDITVPFGGVRQSGFGRDKSLHALDKYSSLKTTWIRLD